MMCTGAERLESGSVVAQWVGSVRRSSLTVVWFCWGRLPALAWRRLLARDRTGSKVVCWSLLLFITTIRFSSSAGSGARALCHTGARMCFLPLRVPICLELQNAGPIRSLRAVRLVGAATSLPRAPTTHCSAKMHHRGGTDLLPSIGRPAPATRMVGVWRCRPDGPCAMGVGEGWGVGGFS